ncbi:ATPase involved in DNA repair [Pseudomonas syringae pv. philadelphi]|uniref:ATPase involved in DNA repair n=2 Tax=Pseudomonas TaxID=286 RepID=A0A3M3ZEJ1_9PSED|nr:ATPase involved in DNA repair [Pseudomonas syringae pv. philadelphi]
MRCVIDVSMPQQVSIHGQPLACAVTFLYRVRPLKFAREIKMLEASLSQLEQLVGDLVQQNQALQETNAQLNAELAKARDENENLQLSLMEQEEKQGSTAARIQALVDRATSASAVSA